MQLSAEQQGGLLYGPIGTGGLHLCVDMQRLFEPGQQWQMLWMERVIPCIEELVSKHTRRTIFTRFIPPEKPEDVVGSWARYYRRWSEITRSQLDPALIDLVPSLKRFVPPARILDKQVYSPWMDGAFDALLQGSEIDTIIITGGETDVCVLATVFGAVDRGYRVIVASDGTCSSCDETHDSLSRLYQTRLSQQVEIATIPEILDAWR